MVLVEPGGAQFRYGVQSGQHPVEQERIGPRAACHAFYGRRHRPCITDLVILEILDETEFTGALGAKKLLLSRHRAWHDQPRLAE